MNEWTFNPIGGSTLVVLSAVALLAACFAFGRVADRLSGRQRLALMGLRIAIFLLVLLAMLRPTRVFTDIKKQPATLVILADRSRSMLVPDSLNGKTRWDSLKTVVQNAIPLLDDLPEELEVKFYTFDSELHPVQLGDGPVELGQTADGKQTAIGATIEDALRREAGKRVAGVLLLSDGAHQAYAPRDLPPEMPVRRMADLGYPLYTLAFGQARSAGQSRDVAVKELLVNPTVFVKNELPVDGAALFTGVVNKDTPAQVLFEVAPGEMKVMDTVNLRATKDAQQLPIRLKLIPDVPGEHKLTLRVPCQDGELVTSNNELSTFVTVLKGGLNVLYLEGSLRAEQRFLRRSLNASPDIKVDYQWIDERQRSNWPVNVSEHMQPGKFDVYVLGDIDSSAFRREDLEALRERVRGGAGLIMLGGFHSFWGGGYQNTALAEVLPVQADALERGALQRFDQPVRKDLHLAGPIKMVPGRRFGQTSMMMLTSPQQNRAAWEGLPPLQGANRFSALKGTAKVLAESTDGKPLLVAEEPGRGRTLAFAADSTWQWWMQGFEGAHKRFWRQVILWLAHKDESTEGSVSLKLDQRRYTPGRRVEFTAAAQTALGEPIAGAQFQAEVTLPDGSKQPVRLTRQGDQVSGTILQTEQPGDYTIAVTATQESAAIGTARARFLVFEQDLELDNAAARPSLLAHLAEITKDAGGQALAAEQLPALLKKLKEQPPDLEVETQSTQTPWDSPGYFLLMVGLMTTEWYLRKKWGLV